MYPTSLAKMFFKLSTIGKIFYLRFVHRSLAMLYAHFSKEIIDSENNA